MGRPASRVPAIALAAALILSPSWGARAQSCPGLKDLTLADTRIIAAESVAPAPEWPFPPSLFNALSRGPKAVTVPFCRVVAVIGTETGVEVWLPKDWNGRLESVGNAGLTGALNYPAMGDALAGGYATASTDTGHLNEKGFFETSWIPGHPERVIEFAYRAHHRMAVLAKQLIQAFYAKPAAHAYYNGCSSGGWEGMSEAERYPGDYDGIVAGAPAINFVRLQSRALWIAGLGARDPAGDLAPAKVKLLVDAAIARCDARDGVKDGVIEDPTRCDFDPARLQCKAADLPTCLTAPQVARARALYGRSRSPHGLTLYPGAAWGATAVFAFGGPDANRPLDETAMILMLKDRPAWTAASFDVDRDLGPVEAELGPTLDAMSSDLKPFKAHGGKLILYHGWADPLLSPYNTVDYYLSVEKSMAPAPVTDFLRLFMVPGMGHCAGGPGTDSFDKMAAITRWVEVGAAPDRILAEHLTDGRVDRSRPLCPYPQSAHYDGSGSTDAAGSFTCRGT